jgi:hypothetical protein
VIDGEPLETELILQMGSMSNKVDAHTKVQTVAQRQRLGIELLLSNGGPLLRQVEKDVGL